MRSKLEQQVNPPALVAERQVELYSKIGPDRVDLLERKLGHSNLGITSVYLQGIDNAEIIDTVHARRTPMIPVSASPRS